jgi:undecaprenyl diphosphate synthase
MNTLTHLACIMDGNRRWAYARGLPVHQGYREGMQAIQRTLQFCINKRIKYVSFYLFSLENMQRCADEQRFLFSFMSEEADAIIQQAKNKDIRIRFVGDMSHVAPSVLRVCQRIEQETKAGVALAVDMLFFYSGQQEIVYAAQSLARAVAAGSLAQENITREIMEQHLWSYPTPPPDLIIRTGGFQRLSGFHLYHAAYAELRFLPCMWPELTQEDLERVVAEFYHCLRRFGA